MNLTSTLQKIQENNVNHGRPKNHGVKWDSQSLDELIKNSLFIIVTYEWYENCPYTIIEGMSFGKPIIGSDLGGIKELVKDKWNGLLFKHGDEKDLSKKINYLLNNRHLIEKYSQNALEFAINNFNADLYYKKLTKLYYKSIEDLESEIEEYEVEELSKNFFKVRFNLVL